MRTACRAFAALTACCALASPAAAEPASADDIMLPLKTVNDVLGTALSAELSNFDAPKDPNQTTPEECLVANNSTVWGTFDGGWTSFRYWNYADAPSESGADQYRHTATQGVTVYETPGRAGAAFAVIADGVRSCDHRTFTTDIPGEDGAWLFSAEKTEKTALHWSVRSARDPLWHCVVAARVQDRALLQAQLCEHMSTVQAQTAAAKAEKLADLMAARVR